jgi:putative ABC transport system permease protein
MTIIGVVEDNQHGSLTASLEPQMFTNIRQAPPYSVWMAVRTSTEPTAAVAAIEQAVRTADPDIPLSEIATMEQLVAQSTGRPRMLATLVGVFAAVAVALAGIGLYGVLSFLVGQRVKEIGVRMALGGRPGSIVRLFVKQGAMFVVPGLAVGLVGAFTARSAVAGLLFGIEPLDPASYVSALTALLAIATLAIVMPVRRATRIDPMKTLRIE